MAGDLHNLQQAWRSRHYTLAASLAASAAEKAGNTPSAAKLRAAADLARLYEATRQELREGIALGITSNPVLEPRDPASTEARCNMLCEPDRPDGTGAANAARERDAADRISAEPGCLPCAWIAGMIGGDG